MAKKIYFGLSSEPGAALRYWQLLPPLACHLDELTKKIEGLCEDRLDYFAWWDRND